MLYPPTDITDDWIVLLGQVVSNWDINFGRFLLQPNQLLPTEVTCLDAILAQMLLLINIAEAKSTALSPEDIISSVAVKRGHN